MYRYVSMCVDMHRDESKCIDTYRYVLLCVDTLSMCIHMCPYASIGSDFIDSLRRLLICVAPYVLIVIRMCRYVSILSAPVQPLFRYAHGWQLSQATVSCANSLSLLCWQYLVGVCEDFWTYRPGTFMHILVTDGSFRTCRNHKWGAQARLFSLWPSPAYGPLSWAPFLWLLGVLR